MSKRPVSGADAPKPVDNRDVRTPGAGGRDALRTGDNRIVLRGRSKKDAKSEAKESAPRRKKKDLDGKARVEIRARGKPAQSDAAVGKAAAFSYITPGAALNGTDIPAPTVAIQVYDLKGAPVAPVNQLESTDEKATRARKLAASILAFYYDVFGRNSYDNQGGRILLVLGDVAAAGAMRDPNTESLRFSDALDLYRDPPNAPRINFAFRAFADAPDYMAHEFQHAVTAHCANLNYGNMLEAALHESFSDVFALTFLNWANGRSGRREPLDWRFGVGTAFIVTPTGLTPTCTRNFDDPHDALAWDAGFADVPDMMLNLKSAFNAYQLSYIPTRAFRASALWLGDILDVARIWYAALTSEAAMKSVKTIHQFANLTCGVAKELDELLLAAGKKGALFEAVNHGWSQVGIVTRPVDLGAQHGLGAMVEKFREA